LVSKDDVELELQESLPDGYTESYISSLSDTAESIIQDQTNRISFTGGAANRYNRACLCWVINALVSAAPSLLKSSISKIKENDSEITFSNGRGISTYLTEYIGLVSGLAIKTAGSNYTCTNETTFYKENS